MTREHYFTVEGPKGRIDIFEITEATAAESSASFEPIYEVVGQGEPARYSSEGEAITVAQELAGVSSRY